MLSGKLLNIFMQNTETTDLSAFTCGLKLSGDDSEAMRPWCSLFNTLCFFFSNDHVNASNKCWGAHLSSWTKCFICHVS